MKITTDLTGTESAATRHARIKAIYDWYFGTGAYVAAGNLGVAREALNGLLTSDIANGETFASWLVKMNSLNDLDTFIPSIIFAGGHKGIVIDPEVLSSMSQDTAGATPVTAAGQSVGRILDRSGNAMHPVQATSAARPTYQVDGSSRPVLRFDGVDDRLATPSITWGTDAVTLVASLSLTPTGIQSVIATGGGTLSQTGFLLSKLSTDRIRARSSGTAVALADSVASVSGAEVCAMQGDISTPLVLLRRNGAQVSSNSATQGTGTFAASEFQIGSLSGSQFLSGDIYGLLAVNRILTTQELRWVEKWLALKNGVTIA